MRFGKSFIIFGFVVANHEISHVKFLNILAAVTQRLTLSRSPSSERFGEKGQNDRLLPSKLFEGVMFPVRTDQFKVRSFVSNFEIHGSLLILRDRSESRQGENGDDHATIRVTKLIRCIVSLLRLRLASLSNPARDV